MIERRKTLGLTQQDVANAAGIAPNYLSQIETGARNGRGEVVARLSQVLQVPLERFYEDALVSNAEVAARD